MVVCVVSGADLLDEVGRRPRFSGADATGDGQMLVLDGPELLRVLGGGVELVFYAVHGLPHWFELDKDSFAVGGRQ